MEPITIIAGYAIKKIIHQSVFADIPEDSIPIGDQDGNGMIDYVADMDGDGIIETLINIF